MSWFYDLWKILWRRRRIFRMEVHNLWGNYWPGDFRKSIWKTWFKMIRIQGAIQIDEHFRKINKSWNGGRMYINSGYKMFTSLREFSILHSRLPFKLQEKCPYFILFGEGWTFKWLWSYLQGQPDTLTIDPSHSSSYQDLSWSSSWELLIISQEQNWVFQYSICFPLFS